MCAICGIINFDHAPVDGQVVAQMRDVMRNRGPEHGGLYLKRHVGLGHRRLKIIDLSSNANQPIANEDGTVWVVYNGEIYNFQELRKLLQQRGHCFQSQSDTEVIVHGYEEWGERIVERLDGMFAFGLWDARTERLLLARDRFGKKPLFYLHRDDSVCFASEIKALWSMPGARFTLNHQAIDCYLHHLAVTQEHCIFKEIQKVKPAHYVLFTRERCAPIRYWVPSFGPRVRAGEAELIERVDATLRGAVKKRLISDVPLGAFLSGGVDSSLVVALMSQLTGHPVKTFSIGFEEGDFSELQFARRVAQRYQTDHQEIILKPDVLDILPALVWEYGEPFADSSAVPSYYVSQSARRCVTVALTGDGGDEMFGGYDIARVAWYGYHYDCFCPAWLRQVIERSLLPDGGWGDKKPWLHKLKTLAIQAHPDLAVRHSYSMAFAPAQKQRLYSESFQSSLNGHNARHVHEAWWPEVAGLNLIDYHLFQTLVTRLPNDYLVKVDVASMKVALELRSPFLDIDLSNLVGAIDPLVKVRGGRQKYLLKKLAERYLPREVIYRTKRGFALPLTHWLRDQLGPVLPRILSNGSIVQAGWFRRDYVDQLIHEHRSGACEHTHRVWALLWLELWHRMFVDRSLQPGDSLRS